MHIWINIKQIKLISFHFSLFNDQCIIKSSESTFVHIVSPEKIVNVISTINMIYKSLLKWLFQTKNYKQTTQHTLMSTRSNKKELSYVNYHLIKRQITKNTL